MRITRVVHLLALSLLAAAPSAAADLKPQTVAAFERYVRATEANMADARAFLWADSQPPTALLAVRRGELSIERLATLDAGRKIDVPDGLIHHWIGTVFVSGATVDQAVALLQDYDRHAEIYRPAVVRSRLGSTARASRKLRVPILLPNARSPSVTTAATCGGSTVIGVSSSATAARTCNASRSR